MVKNRRGRFGLVLVLSAILLTAVLVYVIGFRQKRLEVGADVTGTVAVATGLSPNASSYFKLFTLLHDGTRYTNTFVSDRITWLREHIDQATTQVAGDVSPVGIPVNRYTNWRDLNTVDSGFFSFETLLTYYQERQQDVDNAFVHVASDTNFVRYVASSRPLPSMNDRLQRVLTVSSLPEQAQSLPATAERQDVTHTAYGDQNVPTMPYDFNLTVDNTTVRYVVLGHNWKFDQLNFNVTTPATAGWQTKFEYWNGTVWLPLTTISDSTNNFNQSGTVHFTPPTDWSASKLPDEPAAYYWLRFSETSQVGLVTFTAHKINETAANNLVWDGTPAISLTPYALQNYPDYPIYRQYVVVPGWDAANDQNSDGYVDDTEFTNRPNQQASARFRYQSQLPAQYLGGRFEANYADLTYQQFAVDQTRQLLADAHTTRIFFDNGYTTLMLPLSLTYPNNNDPAPNPKYLEYSDEAALRQSAVNFLTALHGSGSDYILLNGLLSQPDSASAIDGLMLENEITLAHSEQEDPPTLALFWNQLKVFSDADKEVIVQAQFKAEERFQLYALARYYLTATPNTYYWIQNGASWSAWSDLMSRNLGEAEGDYRLVASDVDKHSYVYRRDFTLGTVFVKTKPTDTDDNTIAHVDLGQRYYPVSLNNQVQPPVTGIDLRNYEGMVLLKDQPPTITPIAGVALQPRVALDQRVTASDSEGGTITITAPTLPNGAQLTNEPDGYHLRWQPTPRVTAYDETFTVQADDGQNQVQLSFKVAVPADRPPTFTSLSDQTTKYDRVLDVALPATDPEGDRVLVTASDLPPGARLTTQDNISHLTWTPVVDQAGQTYTIKLTVTDGIAQSQASFTVKVEPKEQTVTIAPPPEVPGLIQPTPPPSSNKRVVTKLPASTRKKTVTASSSQGVTIAQASSTGFLPTATVDDVPYPATLVKDGWEVTMPTQSVGTHEVKVADGSGQYTQVQVKVYPTTKQVIIWILVSGLLLVGVWLLARKIQFGRSLSLNQA
ncbi:MAG: putative glycoside hydrolase [bacterium]|nr:putative glycoside hydrolase [bacterium]